MVRVGTALEIHLLGGWGGVEEGVQGLFGTCSSGHISLDQVALSSIQSHLKLFQGRGSYASPGQPLPGPHYPHREKFLSNIPSKPTLDQFEAISPSRPL